MSLKGVGVAFAVFSWPVPSGVLAGGARAWSGGFGANPFVSATQALVLDGGSVPFRGSAEGATGRRGGAFGYDP